MYRCYLEWTIFILCGHILPAVWGDGCASKCKYSRGRYSLGDKAGAPTLRWTQTTKNIVLNQQADIQCALCQSNPPSTLTWLLNGRPLQEDLKGHIKSFGNADCKPTLLVRVRNAEDAGNYTCVVKNRLGNASATTKVVYAVQNYPAVYIGLQVNVKRYDVRVAYDVRVGWPLNITCSQATKCRITWFKDDKEFRVTPDKRIVLVEDEARTGSQMRECSSKLRIKNATADDTGRYKCTSDQFKSEDTININVVICFQGYYCPGKNMPAQRCPGGTFSSEKNATSVDHCKPCSTHRNDFKGKTAEIFRGNCQGPATKDLRKTSSLSTGVKVAIGISVVIFVLTVTAVFCGLRSRWKHKNSSDFFLPDAVEIEIPDVQRSNDVFICYSNKNAEWVLETLHGNLKAQGFQTCIDIVDFEGGIEIHQNITNAIYGSRKTVFVLSKDSLKSYYARTELRQALVAGRAGRAEVIVILYEKCAVPAEIFTNKIYLDWTDIQNREIFWDKLYRAIRRPLPDESV